MLRNIRNIFKLRGIGSNYPPRGVTFRYSPARGVAFRDPLRKKTRITQMDMDKG